jgi:hypothetical protein
MLRFVHLIASRWFAGQEAVGIDAFLSGHLRAWSTPFGHRTRMTQARQCCWRWRAEITTPLWIIRLLAVALSQSGLQAQVSISFKKNSDTSVSVGVSISE